MTLRCALQAGLTAEQLRGIAGGQLERVLGGRGAADLGPAPGAPPRPLDPLLERVVTHLDRAGPGVRAHRPGRVARARPARLRGRRRAPARRVFAAVLELLDLYDEHLAPPTAGRPSPAAARLLVPR